MKESFFMVCFFRLWVGKRTKQPIYLLLLSEHLTYTQPKQTCVLTTCVRLQVSKGNTIYIFGISPNLKHTFQKQIKLFLLLRHYSTLPFNKEHREKKSERER